MRILIAGRPHTGKTTLALKLGGQLKIPVLHTDGINRTFTWSAQSVEVAAWFNRPGPWIIEGMTVVRAIRKFMSFAQDKPSDVVYWGSVPYGFLDPAQRKFGEGASTVWEEIRDKLLARGVEIRQIR